MLVRRISPAPSSTPGRAQSTASSSVGLPAAMGVDPPTRARAPGSRLASIARTMHCAPKRSEAARIRSGVGDRRRVERDLVRPRLEHRLDVVHRTEPAADRQGHEALLRGRGDHFAQDAASVARGGDVEENEFVRPLGVIGPGALDGVPASRSSWNLTPLTTRPAVTSRQG